MPRKKPPNAAPVVPATPPGPEDRSFRALVEGCIAGIAVLSRQRRIVFANQAFANMFGYAAPAEIIGRPSVDFIAPQERERMTAMFQARISGAPVASRYEYEGLRQDGASVWIDRLTTMTEWQGEPAVQATFIDITDRRQAEAELVAKRQLLDTLLESVPVGLGVVDQDLRIAAHNRLGADMYDLPWDLMQPGCTFEAVIRYNAERGEYGPGEPEAQTRERVQLARKFLPHHVERQRPDGRWLEIRGNPLPGGGFVSVTADITERKRMEEALADSRRLFQTVFDSLPLWISVKDRDGRYLLCNRLMAEELGLDPQTVAQHDALTIPVGTRGDREKWHALDQQVLESGSKVEVVEAPFTLPSGREVLQQYAKVPLRDAAGQIVGIVSVIQDITARRHTEQALLEFKTTLDRTLDCVFMFNPDTLRFVYVNRGAREQVGYDEQELLRMTPVDIKPEYDEPAFRTLIAPLRSGARDSLTFETLHVTKGGARVPVEVFLQYVEPAPGTARFVAIVRDITERQRLEAQLRQSQKMEAVGTLAGGIAHDFNNALVPILGYTQLLQQRAAPGSEEMRWLQVVEQAAERARGLVAQILLYARQSAPRQEQIRLAAIIREVVRFLHSSLPANIVIEADLASEGWVDADPVQLHQVLMNLCINAAQAMPDGGALRIALHTVEVADLACYSGRRLSGLHHRLSVSDAGVGMDAETLGHIFEPFFTTKEVGQGTGLGLSTVLGIVQAHGGAVQVQSTPGHGASFAVYLPVAKAHTGVAQLPPAQAARGRERILLVDDESDIVEVGQAILERLGYQVVGLTDAREALALLERDPRAFDLVITDWTMPHINGDRLAARLRALNPQVPILLCTGFAQDAVPDGVGREAITRMIYKPFRIEELAAVLRGLLGTTPP